MHACAAHGGCLITVTSHEGHSASYQLQADCLSNSLLRLTTKNIPKLCMISFWWGKPPLFHGFPRESASSAGSFSCHDIIMVIHYNDVIMTTIASQITSPMVVYSTVYSDPDQRKHQSSASLAFVWGIHRDRWIPRTKGQLRGKCFHLMTSSWYVRWIVCHVNEL